MEQNTLTDLRREIKFIAYEVEYPYIKNWLLLNSAGFAKSFPERQVNNIYFDSSNFPHFTKTYLGKAIEQKYVIVGTVLLFYLIRGL